MNISILIPNHSDLRMEKMIRSIDYYDNDEHHVELVIVLNRPTKEVQNLVTKLKKEYRKQFKFNIVYVEKCNLGLVYNEGITHASYDNILFIDTDIICGKNSIKKTVNAMGNAMVVKARIVYKNMNGLVEKARLINTTDVRTPYIPIILINRRLFEKLKDDFMFAVDTVWCSDAEFAYRVLNEGVKINYADAEFYHDKISMKKDLHDALLYGFGKGVRIKRTREKWHPFKEIREMYQYGRKSKLTMIENIYAVIWITLQQMACFIQQFIPNVFKESLPFEHSASIKHVVGGKEEI